MSRNSQLAHTVNRSAKRNIFYKTDEIRFKGFASSSYKKLPRQQYVFEKNPWLSLDDKQMGLLVDRLEDQPQQLYKIIQQKKRKGKFTLLKNTSQKQNLSLIKNLQSKKLSFEQQFKSILRDRKPQALTIILPKLQGLNYLYGDSLHRIQNKKLAKSRIQ